MGTREDPMYNVGNKDWLIITLIDINTIFDYSLR